jgi:hypothetical protein
VIAQSELNSGRTPVVYACATNDLVRQTATEAEEKLGLTFTTRIEGEFSNTLFEEGKAICITNYNAIFTSRSAFRGQLFPRSVIFDDAHVAENALRGSLTVSVLSHKHSSVYAYIRAVIRDYFSAIGSKVEFEATLNPNSPSILYVPPKCISEKESEVLTMLRDLAKVDKEVMFPLDHIALHLSHCAVTISNEKIEFTPPFVPISAFRILKDEKVRRHYLSATLGSETEFIRAFGRKPHKIELDTDAGNGERLIPFC